MSSIIVKVTRDQHRKVKREAKDRELTVSDYVRERLDLQPSTIRGETGERAGDEEWARECCQHRQSQGAGRAKQEDKHAARVR